MSTVAITLCIFLGGQVYCQFDLGPLLLFGGPNPQVTMPPLQAMSWEIFWRPSCGCLGPRGYFLDSVLGCLLASMPVEESFFIILISSLLEGENVNCCFSVVNLLYRFRRTWLGCFSILPCTLARMRLCHICQEWGCWIMVSKATERFKITINVP